MRALFFGTPEIAVPALEALHEVAEIAAVVSQPDRPAGRGLALRPPPVKQRALELGLEVHQPTKVRTPDFAEWVASKQADVALVMAYGRILTQQVLEAPARGCMNLHASLLPQYRGASPITWAIVHGETETGISLMQMDAGLDTGPVYSMHRLTINRPNEFYSYDTRVITTITENKSIDYLTAANIIKQKNYQVLSIQHEFGIYGGEECDYLLDRSRIAEGVRLCHRDILSKVIRVC